MTDEPSSRFPSLSKLSIAILEHLTEPIVGKDAQDVLKAPVTEGELQAALAHILQRAEDRFKADHQDKQLGEVFFDLPLATLPSIQSAVRDFYSQPDDLTLRSIFIAKLRESLPNVELARVEVAVDADLRILKQELIKASPTPEFRDKVSALILQAMQADTAQTPKILSEIQDSLKGWPESYRELSALMIQAMHADTLQTRQILSDILSLLKSWREPAAIQAPQVKSTNVDTREAPVNQFDKLRTWLDRLIDSEYRDLMRALLTPEEQNRLPLPLMFIDRGSFLGHMQGLMRLDQVEEYLAAKYSARLFR